MTNEKRLIDANALKELISRRSGDMQNDWTSPAVLLAVECQPTVDAVEVVHGRWKERHISIIGQTKYFCSECLTFHDSKSNYCPNCGAKMDGERKDNG